MTTNTTTNYDAALDGYRKAVTRAIDEINTGKGDVDRGQQTLVKTVLDAALAGVISYEDETNHRYVMTSEVLTSIAGKAFKRCDWFLSFETDGEYQEQTKDFVSEWSAHAAECLAPSPYAERTRVKFLKTNPSDAAIRNFDNWLKDQSTIKAAVRQAGLMLVLNAQWNDEKRCFGVQRRHFLPIRRGVASGAFKYAARCFDSDQIVYMVPKRKRSDSQMKVAYEHLDNGDQTGMGEVNASWAKFIQIWSTVPKPVNAATSYATSLKAVAAMSPGTALTLEEVEQLNKALAALTAWKAHHEAELAKMEKAA